MNFTEYIHCRYTGLTGRLTALLLLAMAVSGCIKNDIPYPRIQADILSIAAEGEASPATIDNEQLSVTLYLEETTDPGKVRFTEFTYPKDVHSSVDLLEGTYDLTNPLKVTMSLYQNYEWVISARQNIERYFTLAGQIGETAIDVQGRRIVLYVSDRADKSNLTVTSLKLGPEGITTVTPELKVGESYDFSHPVNVDVTYFGKTEEWTIYVDVTKAIVTTTQADAWVNVVWVYGEGPEDAVNGFRYRQAGETDWHEVSDSYVTHTGGSFHAYIPHLLPLTEYEVMAYSGQNDGDVLKVTTGVAMTMPNADFEYWWKNGKIECPWPQGGEQWWDTGNTGASTLGQSNVTPSDFTPDGQGRSACLETRFVGIGPIGKLAAGSIYAGSFRKVDGTNGILDFGQPWTERPTKLKGYYHYTPGTINYASAGFENLKGQPDTCHIWVALTDMDAPYEIRTNPNNRHLFNRNDPQVIAYGELCRGTATNGWEEFEVKFEYKATNRKPKYLLVVGASSKYGDYFTGGTGSTLYLDQLSLDYDY